MTSKQFSPEWCEAAAAEIERLREAIQDDMCPINDYLHVKTERDEARNAINATHEGHMTELKRLRGQMDTGFAIRDKEIERLTAELAARSDLCDEYEANVKLLREELRVNAESGDAARYERDKACEASERLFQRWQMAISMLPDVDEDKARVEFAKWREQYPWLEEE